MQQFRSSDQQLTWVHIYGTGISTDKANTTCADLIQSINDNRSFIQREQALRGWEIAKRWKKKTSKGREGILKTANPGMYPRKWHEPLISYEARYVNWLVEARKHQVSRC
jgi:hypothetical protein